MRFLFPLREQRTYTEADTRRGADANLRLDWLHETGVDPAGITFGDLFGFEPALFGVRVAVNQRRRTIPKSLWTVTVNFGLARTVAITPLTVSELYATPVPFG